MGTRCADHVTPLYPQKLALTSPTGGGRSVGIVRSRTKATEFSLVYIDAEVGTWRSDTNSIISLPLKLQVIFYYKCVYPSEVSG